MRRLIAHLERARAVQREDGERGAVAVLTALLLVVLLGFAALAIDVGMLYAERAELQSGADAAALAIAQSCGTGSPACATPVSTAQEMADANAKDGAAAVAEATVGGSTARVRLTTREQGGAGSLALSFAPVLGIDSATVGAAATARWGGPVRGPAVLPIVVPECEVQITGRDVVIDLHGNGSGSSCNPGGRSVPGGFGWYETPGGTSCGAVVAVGDIVDNDPGINFPRSCDDELERLENGTADRTILLPVYRDSGGSGNNGWYRIRGWAAFELDGWNFTGHRNYNSSSCTGSCKGITGRFVRYTDLDGGFEAGPENTFGTTVVELTG